MRAIGKLSSSLALIAGLLLMLPAPAYAHRLDKATLERHHIEERGRSVMSTRYNYGGGSPSSGFDCSGFTSWVFRDHGAELPRRSIDQFHMAGSNEAVRIWKFRNLVKGDLVFFKTTSARVGHAGIYLGEGRFIHSSSAAGEVRISPMDSGFYRETFVGATRVKAIRN